MMVLKLTYSEAGPQSFADLLPRADDPRERELRGRLGSADPPTRAEAALELGAAALADAPDVALRLLRQAAMEGKPIVSARAHLRMARLAYKEQDLQRTRELLDQAGSAARMTDDNGELDLEMVRVRLDIGACFALINQSQAALTMLNELDTCLRGLGRPERRDAPEDPELRQLAAFVSLRLGEAQMSTNDTAAADALRRAVVLGDGAVRAKAAFDLGKYLEFDIGGLGAEIEELYRIAADGDDAFIAPDARIALADFWFQSGRRQSALAAWQRVRKESEGEVAKRIDRRLDGTWQAKRERMRRLRVPTEVLPLKDVQPLTGLGRIASRRTYDDPGHTRRAIIVGAGTGGHYLLPELKHGWDVVGFVDTYTTTDFVEDKPVLGKIADLGTLIDDEKVDHVIFAIPTAEGSARLQVLRAVHSKPKVKVLALPTVFELHRGFPLVPQLRQLRVQETFGEGRWDVDREASGRVRGKTVMITGAGTTLGTELARRVALGQPAQLVLVDEPPVPLMRIADELQLRRDMLDCEARILDCADAVELDIVFKQYRPDIVLHCGGISHPRIAALGPLHAARANVLAAWQVAQAAARWSVSSFVLASVDHAATRATTFDYSKALAEAGVLSLSDVEDAPPPPGLSSAPPQPPLEVSVMRLPNLWGDGGSVIEQFEEQLRGGGPLLVNMAATRVFVHPWEAAHAMLRLIGQGGGRFAYTGGELVEIKELAARMLWINGLVPDVDIKLENRVPPHAKLSTALWGDGETCVPWVDDAVVRIEQSGDLEAQLLARFTQLTEGLEAEAEDRVRLVESALDPEAPTEVTLLAG